MNKGLIILMLGLIGLMPQKICAQINQSAHAPLNDSTASRKVVINNIFILGNEKTKKSIITRELSTNPGDTLSLSRLIGYQTEDAYKIYNTNLFNTVDIHILETDSVNVDLLVKVTERWYLYPGLIFELSDRNFNDWWVNRNHDLNRVNYGLKLNKFNLRGRDETLFLTAQFGFENLFLLNYVMPYIDRNQKFGLILDAGYAEYKNLPYQTVDHLPTFILSREMQRRSFGISVSPSYRPSFYIKHYITAGFSTAAASDSVISLNPNYFGDGMTSQTFLRLSYSFSRDYRDNHTYPLKGDLITASISKSGLGVFNEYNRWYLSAAYYKYFDLGKNFYLGSKLGGHLSTADVPYSKYTSLGFENYIVRGYELSVVEGYATFLFKNSLRYRIIKTAAHIDERFMPIKQFRRWPIAVYTKLFFDAGYVENYPNYPLNTRLSNKALYSVGLGMDLVTIHDITIRLEQSYNAERQFNFVIGIEQDL